MPKMKTNKGAAKRFKRTGSGAWKRASSNHNHILTKKSAKRKSRLQKLKVVCASDVRSVDRMLLVR